MLQAQTEPEWEFAEHTQAVWDPYRIKILKGGRGGVKSWTAARKHLIEGFQQPLRVLCGREVQKSIRESVHQLLSDQIELLGLGGFYEILSTEIRGRNGTRFTYAGISQLTTDSIKSYEGYDRFWGEESHTFSRRSLDILTPTFRKDGSELMFTLNPELDTDEIWARYIETPDDDTLIIDCSYHNNPWFPDVLEKERQSFLRQVEMGKRTQSDYDWIWEGKCKPAVDGAIYPNEVAATMKGGRLFPVQYEATLKVFCVFDIGWNDSMAIGVVQVSPGAVRMIDYIEDDHRTYEFYINGIDADGEHTGVGLLDKPYAKQIKTLYLPQDGKKANPQTGKSDEDTCNDLLKDKGIDVQIVEDIGVKQGIQAVREMFPRVYFDKENCTTLFNRLRRYKRKINKETGVATTPTHDENSHGADMMRYLAVIEKELTNEDEDFSPIDYDDAGIV